MQIPAPYQEVAQKFLVRTRRGLLADEPGVGKTLPAIRAALELKEPTLVICPANLKVDPWARTIIDQDPEAQVHIVDPGDDIHAYATGNGSKWLIVNYDLLDKYQAEGLRAILPYKTLIIDEAHCIKELTTQRTEVAQAVGESADNIFLLTGTPILNRPIELYSLLKITGHPLSRNKKGEDNWYGYAYRYCDARMQNIQKTILDPETHQYIKTKIQFFNSKGASNLPELHRRLQDFYLRRKKSEVLKELPKKVPTVKNVQLSPEWALRYKQTWDRYIAYLEKIKRELVIDLGSERAYYNKVRNITSSRHLVELQKLRQVTSRAKIKEVTADAFNLVRNRGKKVIIFCAYTDTIKEIKRILAHNKIKVVVLDGSTKSDARTKAKDAFQSDPDTMVFIGNIKAAGVGITLHASHKVLFIDRDWTPGINEQAEDRAHRRGQLQQVDITYYDAIGTVDDATRELLAEKQEVINAVWSGKTVKNKEAGIAKAIMQRTLAHSNLSTLLE